MNFPPPGYDDERIVPQNRLKFLLGQFEDELSRIQAVFQQSFPEQFHAPPAPIEQEFSQFRDSAHELGSDYPFLVEKLIADYEHFRDAPSEERLEQLFSEVKSLQLLLAS